MFFSACQILTPQKKKKASPKPSPKGSLEVDRGADKAITSKDQLLAKLQKLGGTAKAAAAKKKKGKANASSKAGIFDGVI